MLSLRVVEHLDVVEHVLRYFLACSLGPAPYPLALEETEEVMRHGVVVTVATSAHRVRKIVELQERRPVHAGGLGTLIGVDQEFVSRLSTPHQQRLQHDIGGLVALPRPADGAAQEKVDHHGQIGKAFLGPNVGDEGVDERQPDDLYGACAGRFALPTRTGRRSLGRHTSRCHKLDWKACEVVDLIHCSAH